MTYHELPQEEIKSEDVPFYFQHGTFGPIKSESLIYCGEVKQGWNEPYCFTEEKQCSGHICRVLAPKSVISRCNVIRDDGTVWRIDLNNFLSVTKLDIVN